MHNTYGASKLFVWWILNIQLKKATLLVLIYHVLQLYYTVIQCRLRSVAWMVAGTGHPSLLITSWSFLPSGVDKLQVVKSKNGRIQWSCCLKKKSLTQKRLCWPISLGCGPLIQNVDEIAVSLSSIMKHHYCIWSTQRPPMIWILTL